MKIEINDNRKIFAIQKEFNSTFPYLKLEFFSRPHTTGGPSSKKFVTHNSKSLLECRTIHTSGTVTITPSMTVSELEQHFKDVFGLNVQVFRRSGKTWLETTATDSWTLQEQNTQGKELTEMSI